MILELWVITSTLDVLAKPPLSPVLTSAPSPPPLLIPVTGGETVTLNDTTAVSLQLPTGDQVTIPPGSGDSASISPLTAETLPGGLPRIPGAAGMAAPPAYEIVSALSVNILNGGSLVPALPHPFEISFVVPDAYAGRTLAVMFWDPALNGGLGGWTPVSFTLDGDRVRVSATQSGTYALGAQ